LKTVGTVTYCAESRQWAIVCEPHVNLRLKRVFGKLDGKSQGEHRISATPENARDLEWFLERYPMEVREPERLRSEADEHRERAAFIEQILAGAGTPEQFELALPARDYQRIAASLLLRRGSLLLADDVGLGKTATAIAALTDPRTRPATVVTLTHLPRQWKAEIAKFAPSLNVHIVKQGTPYNVAERRRGQLTLLGGVPDVFILNYHKLSGWAQTLAGICHSVVFDECQELRKRGSNKYAAAEYLAKAMAFRMGLSATPIYNYGFEFFNVLDCLFPGELGNGGEFAQEWCSGWNGDKSPIKDPVAFGSYLRSSGMMLRRTRRDVGRELPEVQVIPHFVESDPAALDRVSRSCAELAKLILNHAQMDKGVKMRASEELSNTLRQATGIAKAPYVAEFVRLLLESGERVVLYGWHREVYSIWLDRLREFKPAFYTGTESVPQKEEAKRRFVDGETPLMIISLRSGAGLDGLQQVCRTVVFGELDWSPGVHEQNIGRVNRDGQPDPVVAYYLLAEDGADPIMAEVLGLKRQQIEGVRRAPGDGEMIEKLQNDGGQIRRLAERYLTKQVRTRAEVA
jgi:SNF2 family DNA or RNA helicase